MKLFEFFDKRKTAHKDLVFLWGDFGLKVSWCCCTKSITEQKLLHFQC